MMKPLSLFELFLYSEEGVPTRSLGVGLCEISRQAINDTDDIVGDDIITRFWGEGHGGYY